MPASVGRARIGHAHRGRARGFTLTELMAVVAIMAVLATLAISAFRRKVFASDVTQAQTALRAIQAAEERFRSLNQVYLDVSAGPTNENQGWYPDTIIPKNTKRSFVNTTHPDYAPVGKKGWRHLNPPITRPVEFVFKVNAGLPSTPVDSVAIAKSAFTYAANSGTEPWYVAQARADADGDGIYSVVVATSFMPEVRYVNEGE